GVRRSSRRRSSTNALVFPGLGAIVAGATPVSDEMLLAAADTVAGFVDASMPAAPNMVRDVSLHVTAAVATAANANRLRGLDISGVESLVRGAMWEPSYRSVRPEAVEECSGGRRSGGDTLQCHGAGHHPFVGAKRPGDHGQVGHHLTRRVCERDVEEIRPCTVHRRERECEQ